MEAHKDASSPGSYLSDNSDNENYVSESSSTSSGQVYSIPTKINLNNNNTSDSYSSGQTPSTPCTEDSDESLNYKNCYPNNPVEDSQIEPKFSSLSNLNPHTLFYNYPLQQYLSTTSFDNLVNQIEFQSQQQQQSLQQQQQQQAFLPANFEFNLANLVNCANLPQAQNNNAQQESFEEEEEEVDTKQTPVKSNPLKNNRQQQQEKKKQEISEQGVANNFLMQPPDSESLAAATVAASINRGKRRTRTKFDKKQLEILEAAFQRTHYPDVNIVDRLSELLKLSHERISIWFQNRRARFKRSKKSPGDASDLMRPSSTKSCQDDFSNFNEDNSRDKYDDDEEENLNDNSKLNKASVKNAKRDSEKKFNDATNDQTAKEEPRHTYQRSNIFNPILLPNYPTTSIYPQANVYQTNPHMLNQSKLTLPISTPDNSTAATTTTAASPSSSSTSTPVSSPPVTPPQIESRSNTPDSAEEQDPPPENDEELDVKNTDLSKQFFYQPGLYHQSQSYPNFQANMLNNMYHHHHNHNHPNYLIPPSPHYPNIFQPFIDCNLSTPHSNNPYFQNYQNYYKN